MKNQSSFLILLIAFSGMLMFQTSCTKKKNPPEASVTVFPSVGSTSTQFSIDATGSHDEEDDISSLQIRVDWENDGLWETDWTPEKNHQQFYEAEGNYTIRIEVRDTDGGTTTATENLTVTNSSSLVPANSPFSYNVGINYETFTVGRDHRDINQDLDTITKHFKLIKTFHCAGVGTTNVVIDPNQKILIDYFVAHENDGLELAMGTNNSALAVGGYGHPWTPGLMTTKTYTDEWVAMVINSFGSKAHVLKSVKVILLGNEIDRAGPNAPPNPDPLYPTFYKEWIPKSFENLKASLKEAGLGSIPVSTIIAAYPQEVPTDMDSVQTHVTKYIVDHWSADWNAGKPFLMFNDYTGDSGKSTDFGTVITYFEKLDQKFNGAPWVYVGETGYSAEYTAINQVKVVTQIFNWLDSQYKTNKLTIPLFVFMSFDHPLKATGQKEMGIFKDNNNNKPLGLKDGIVVPKWVREKKR